jgi:mRNA interferase MazF
MRLSNSWMKHKQYEIWLADLNPRMGTEPGKTRPVVIIQTDLLNDVHPSTIVCPVTTQVFKAAQILRVHLRKDQLKAASDILVDQIRAIDNKRLIKRLGKLSPQQIQKLVYSIGVVLGRG